MAIRTVSMEATAAQIALVREHFRRRAAYVKTESTPTHKQYLRFLAEPGVRRSIDFGTANVELRAEPGTPEDFENGRKPETHI